MNQEECLNRIYKELMTERNCPFTIVCCFHNRRDMRNFIQSILDKFIYIRKTKINLGTVSDCFSSTVGDNRIFFLHENYQNIEGLNPDLLFFQKRPFYYSNLVDVLKHKTSCLKNSEIYSFE